MTALEIDYFAPLSELKARFHKLAPAQLALRKAAIDFGVLMRSGVVTNQLFAEPVRP